MGSPRALGTTPPAGLAEHYIGYEVLDCQCDLHCEYQPVAAVSGVCHDTSVADSERLNNCLIPRLTDQPNNFSIDDFLKNPPEKIQANYIREILETAYNYRRREEQTALAVACRRRPR